ncbi:MAG TPA: HAMP domain-containing sensor histidine kinase [Geopsychrobacteraceae bacterium]|nr:HAMP domain-containing sensor histidine kinase [Geopsychrobacteraceae bacterium]
MSNELTAHELMDQELVATLKERLDSNRKALHDLREVTKQLELINRKLQESEALKSHFLSNIRNEINNPLTSIMGLSRQLISKPETSENVSIVGPMIYMEAFNLDFQLQNIFIAAELEAGEASPSYSKVDVAGVVDTVLDLQIHQISQKNISVTKLTPESLYFVTDAQKLQIMLLNLLANAIEFTSDGSKVEIVAEQRDGGISLVVKDTGIGIDPDKQARVFDRFHQLDAGTTKKHRGHGLGLSISKALAEMLEGKISLSSAPGEGCTVELFLPEPSVEVNITSQDSNVFLFDEPEEF